MGLFKGSKKERASKLKSIDIHDYEEAVINVYKDGVLVAQHMVTCTGIDVNVSEQGFDAEAKILIY